VRRNEALKTSLALGSASAAKKQLLDSLVRASWRTPYRGFEAKTLNVSAALRAANPAISVMMMALLETAA
jgi:hypothetical protein